jgi:predicted helicase
VATINPSSFRNRWGLHPIFQVGYRNWEELEQAIGSIPGTTEKGDAFEQFCYFYFFYFQDFYEIDEVWCDQIRGREIPPHIISQYKLEKIDYGVDGVNRLVNGNIEAWQAKFHTDRSHAPFSELATFWSEAEYAHYRRIISNSTTLPTVAFKKMRHRQTLVDKFLELDDSFFIELYRFANEEEQIVERPKYSPRPHQLRMVEDVVAGLREHDRGKLIAACGTGKTLAALWITESDALNFSKVLFLAPSIALVAQTLEEWTMHRNKPFSYLVVCSDKSIDAERIEDEDAFQYEMVDLGVTVTTNPAEVEQWITTTRTNRQYIFSTYQSIEVIEEAIQAIGDYKFDLIVFDEAHRTVGMADHRFASALTDNNIPTIKRLFMTATERLINPRVKSLASQAGQEVVSMGDVEKYGPIFHSYNFGHAINDGVIADYQIVLAEVSGEEEATDITQKRLIRVDTGEEVEVAADQLFKGSFLLKSIHERMTSKVITFHSNRRRATGFNEALTAFAEGVWKTSEDHPYITYILGNQNAADRAQRISNFENANLGVLSNVRCLSEGVDIPLIDAVYFVDPKTSLIELVQAIGRALRKPYKLEEKKVASIFVPIRIPEDATTLDDVDWDDALETFHSVIQSMRDQDETLSEEVNEINLYEVTGGTSGRRVGAQNGKIRVVIPANLQLRKKIDFGTFLDRINVRIAQANANPEGSATGYSFLGKGERKSEYKPVLQILGDYNPIIYKNSLVDPTLDRFPELNSVRAGKQIAVNHNNVSHTIRLGLIEEIAKKQFRITRLGRLYRTGNISFDDIFRNQMLLYSDDNLFTYRIVLQILIEVHEINHIEFLYGPYVLQKETDGSVDINKVVKRIFDIRQFFS